MNEKRLLRESTTIAIRKETRDQLASIAKKDQTYDEVIKSLLKAWSNEE